MAEKKVDYKPRHSTAGKTVALRAKPGGKLERVGTKLPAHAKKLPGKSQHAAKYQMARDTKGIVEFGASKTRSGFVKSFDNKMAPRLKPKKSVVTYRHMIAAEFWLGLMIILFSKEEDNPKAVSRWIQLAAFVFVWAILFGLTATGTGGAKVAAALGGLILLTIITKKRTDIFGIFPALDYNKISQKAGNSQLPDTPAPSGGGRVIQQ